MSSIRTKQFVTMLYGITAIAVGVWRHLQTGNSPQAVWFGVVMGSVAMLGAVLLSLKNRLPGYALISVSLCFISGWFLRRMLSGHSDGTSVRVIIILAACAIELAILLRRCPESAGKLQPEGSLPTTPESKDIGRPSV